MTNGNPYLVVPGGDITPGLAGISGVLQDIGAQKREEEVRQKAAEKFATMKAGAMEAFRSGDPDRVAEFMVANPEMGQALKQATAFRSDATKNNYMNSIVKMLPLMERGADIGELEGVITQRQDFLKGQGLTSDQTTHTDNFIQMYQEDPEGTKKKMLLDLATFDPDRYKAYQSVYGKAEETKPTPRIQEYNLAKKQGYKGTFMEYQKKLEEGKGRTKKQKTGAFLVRKPDGTAEIAVGSFDPETGKIKTETAALDGLEIISKLGETAAEETERKIGQKRSELEAAGEEKRAADLIARGIAAAESTASIRRAITLLDEVKTGGFRATALRAKQAFGIEGADEGELSNSLGKAVLSQLRETFGAAFTEAEGKRLERIEANFTKSAETNRRLLTQALRIAEKTANRARKKAVERGDQATIDDIDDLLTFTLDEPEKFKSAADMSDEEILKALEQ